MQRQYAIYMLKKFGMTACKPLDTPLDQNIKLYNDGNYLEDAYMYKKMVRGLIYLTITRPDLSYAIGLPLDQNLKLYNDGRCIHVQEDG